MDIVIREARPEDIPGIKAVGASFGDQQKDGHFERCLAEGRSVFIALLDGRIAGHVQVNWSPAYAPFRAQGVPELQDLAVAPGARGRGIGRKLVEACEGAARARGALALGLGVGLYNAYGPAQRLYARMGYEPDGLGAAYDDVPVRPFELRPVDDNLVLKLVKSLI